MAFLFSASDFGVVVVRRFDGAPGTISFLDKFPQHDSVIITSIGYRQSVNAQFMPSLADLIYVYVFGDKMGDVIISGICFDRTCDTTGTFQGVGRALAYYRDNRAKVTNKSVKVRIGDTEINGFVLSMDVNTADAVNKTMRFSLSIAALPRAASQDEIDAAASAQATADATAAESKESDLTKTMNEVKADPDIADAGFSGFAGAMSELKFNEVYTSENSNEAFESELSVDLGNSEVMNL